MAHAQITGTLRRWEDLTSILLGVAAVIAAIVFHPELDAILINAAITGAVIVALAALDLTVPPHWEEPFEMIAGMWLAVSPFWIGYSGPLQIAHIVIGVAVLILAVLELWQDRKNIEA